MRDLLPAPPQRLAAIFLLYEAYRNDLSPNPFSYFFAELLQPREREEQPTSGLGLSLVEEWFLGQLLATTTPRDVRDGLHFVLIPHTPTHVSHPHTRLTHTHTLHTHTYTRTGAHISPPHTPHTPTLHTHACTHLPPHTHTHTSHTPHTHAQLYKKTPVSIATVDPSSLPPVDKSTLLSLLPLADVPPSSLIGMSCVMADPALPRWDWYNYIMYLFDRGYLILSGLL